MENMRYTGFGKESAYGVEADAEFHVFMTSSSLEAAGGNDLSYEAGPGRDKAIRKAGYYTVSGDVTFAADVQSLRKLFEWTLGTAPLSPGMLMAGSQSRTLPSLTIRVGKDSFEHVFVGCVINSMSIEVSGEFCNVTVSVMGQKDKKAPIKAYSQLLLGELYPLAFYDVASEIDPDKTGTFFSDSDRVQALTLTIENNVDSEIGRTIGGRYPSFMLAGARGVTLSMEQVFRDTQALEALWGGANGVTDAGAKEFGRTIAFTATREPGVNVDKVLRIMLPRCVYTAAPIPISNRDTAVMSLEMEAYSGEFGPMTGVVFANYSEQPS